jgi:hypothetical protein
LIALDGVVALVGLLTTSFYLRTSFGGGPAPHRPTEIGLTLLATAPIAFRRRWPVPVLAMVTTATAVLMFDGRAKSPLS